jgi:hypothetical protein
VKEGCGEGLDRQMLLVMYILITMITASQLANVSLPQYNLDLTQKHISKGKIISRKTFCHNCDVARLTLDAV